MHSKPILIAIMAYLTAFAMAAPIPPTRRSPQLIPGGGPISGGDPPIVGGDYLSAGDLVARKGRVNGAWPFPGKGPVSHGGPTPVLMATSMSAAIPTREDLPQCSDVSKIIFTGPEDIVIPIKCVTTPSDTPPVAGNVGTPPPPPRCSAVKNVSVIIPPGSKMEGTDVAVQCIADDVLADGAKFAVPMGGSPGEPELSPFGEEASGMVSTIVLEEIDWSQLPPPHFSWPPVLPEGDIPKRPDSPMASEIRPSATERRGQYRQW